MCPAPIIILRFNQHGPVDKCEHFLAGSGKLQAKPLQTQLLMDLLRSLQPCAWGYLIFGLKAPYLDLAVRNQFWLQLLSAMASNSVVFCLEGRTYSLSKIGMYFLQDAAFRGSWGR